MAFNFKWSPLAADTSFYTRAQELLTAALNKTPKPPIIVDDIIVNELNLGDIPPDLEVLEIGDLDVDRFRGIFKMCYAGNAFLTLKTRVQANPLNTYLSTKPSFTSPQPLAASSGLTIPIQITLSEIKLSAFIILVYSSQKGVTLVFRNDPLESLKVSSTFDAIPFVRDYLQKEIEKQLRTLLMDELPLIIHRLSLRLFNPEHKDQDSEESESPTGLTIANDVATDPLASPPQDPVDKSGNVLNSSQIASLSLESGSEAEVLFSQKNLLRLSALTDSHRTLSLFTPGIRDVVFRAWTGSMDRGDDYSSSGRLTPAISRSQSYAGNMATRYVVSDGPEGPQSARPMLTSHASAASGLGSSISRSTTSHKRKKKHRVVNLRKKLVDGGEDLESVSDGSTTTSGTGTEHTGTVSSPISDAGTRPKTPEMKEPGDADVGQTPPRIRNVTPRPPYHDMSLDNTPRASQMLPQSHEMHDNRESHPRPSAQRTLTSSSHNNKQTETPRRTSTSTLRFLDPIPYNSPDTNPPALSSKDTTTKRTGSISSPLSKSPEVHPPENAWLNQMASEILRKVQDRKAADRGTFWTPSTPGDRQDESDHDPPPAYDS